MPSTKYDSNFLVTIIRLESGQVMVPARPWDKGQYGMSWDRQQAGPVTSRDNFDVHEARAKKLNYAFFRYPPEKYPLEQVGIYKSGNTILLAEIPKKKFSILSAFRSAKPDTGEFSEISDKATVSGRRSVALFDRIAHANLIAESLYHIDGAIDIYPEIQSESGKDKAAILKAAVAESMKVSARPDTINFQMPAGPLVIHQHKSTKVMEALAIENGLNVGRLKPLAILATSVLKFQGRHLSSLTEASPENFHVGNAA